MGLEAGTEQLLLQGDGGVHIQVQALVDGLLAGAHGDGSVLRDAGGHLQGGGHQLLGGIDLVHQTDALGLVGLDVAAGVDELLGHAGADQTGQTLGAAEAGGDAQTHLGLTEDGALGADADVTAHRQLVASAQGEAVDGGDDGDGQGLDLAEDIVALLAKGGALGLGQGAHLADVGTGHEAALTGAGDDQAADGVHVQGVDGGVQLLQHGAVQGVEGLGTVDGQDSHGALGLQIDKSHNKVPPCEFVIFLTSHTDTVYCFCPPLASKNRKNGEDFFARGRVAPSQRSQAKKEGRSPPQGSGSGPRWASSAVFEGGALGALAVVGVGVPAAAHLDGVEGAEVLALGVEGAGFDGAMDVVVELFHG